MVFPDDFLIAYKVSHRVCFYLPSCSFLVLRPSSNVELLLTSIVGEARHIKSSWFNKGCFGHWVILDIRNVIQYLPEWPSSNVLLVPDSAQCLACEHRKCVCCSQATQVQSNLYIVNYLRGAYLFQAHLSGWVGGGGLIETGCLFKLEKTVVSVLHKELEYKVEKLKYKKVGDHAAEDHWESNPIFQVVNKPSRISPQEVSSSWLIIISEE